MATTPAENEVVLPALLRFARGTFSHAIKRELAAGGFDDLPRNAPFVLGGMANHGGTAGDLIRELGVTKQAASQLIDTLVLRGYLEREPDADDRRRMTIQLTDRGRAAAGAVRDGVARVDKALAARCSPADIEGLRSGLIALIEVREEWEDEERRASVA